MKQKNLAMLGVAVGCGLVAAIAVAKLSASGTKGADTTRVLVAKKDIPLGTKLEEKDLETLVAWADVPKNIVPPDAVTDLEMVKGKSLNRTLKQGNPVSITDLGDAINMVLPEGYKAITVKATQVDAAGGFAKPGSKVDLMYIERTSTGKARAAIILKDMLVLAVNMVHTLNEKTGAAIPQVESVSLAVTDKQATMVALADEKGKLKLVLRGANAPPVTHQAGEEIEWITDPFDQSQPAPIVAPPTGPKLDQVVVAKKPVPLNTLVNADNVGEYFTTVEVKSAPEGVVTNADDLKGKYVVKGLDQGQYLYKSLTASRPTDVAVPDPKGPIAPPSAAVVERTKFPRFEQVIQEGGQARKIIWLEIAPSKWKRFDSDKDADDYRPEADAPKGAGSKDE